MLAVKQEVTIKFTLQQIISQYLQGKITLEVTVLLEIIDPYLAKTEFIRFLVCCNLSYIFKKYWSGMTGLTGSHSPLNTERDHTYPLYIKGQLLY